MPLLYLRASLLDHLPKIISDLGADPDQVFSKAGLSRSTISSPNNLLSVPQAYELLKAAKDLTGCQHLGLLIGGALTASSLGPSAAMMQTSPTFLDAIKEGLKYIKLNAPGNQRELHIEGDIAYISNTLNIPDNPLTKEAIQFSVAATWRIYSLTSNNQWHPRTICFTFDPPEDKAFYKRFFQKPIIFNADFNGVTFDAADLKIELSGKDKALHDMLQDYVDIIEQEVPSDYVSSIKSIIRKQLNTGSCSIEDIAAFLPYEKRALQRKLDEHGTSYQNILDEVRFEKAIEFLSNSNITMSRLSDILGYKNVSVFSKAFKNRFGVSPKAWQKEQRGAKDG